ncbi:MAG: MATE family efflux transporter, partial [Firmicutes bacterium]|nr:MATE family efflux transporter [Bacillota bacterium]
MREKIGRYFGSKEFYKSVFILVLPMIIQQGVTSFVNLLDNVMVGALSTEAISGVAIVNQLIFVFNLSIFGGFSGAGIFGAQFAGNKD